MHLLWTFTLEKMPLTSAYAWAEDTLLLLILPPRFRMFVCVCMCLCVCVWFLFLWLLRALLFVFMYKSFIVFMYDVASCLDGWLNAKYECLCLTLIGSDWGIFVSCLLFHSLSVYVCVCLISSSFQIFYNFRWFCAYFARRQTLSGVSKVCVCVGWLQSNNAIECC